MKQKLLKLGLLIFSFALIINNHLENSSYYFIKPFPRYWSEDIKLGRLWHEQVDFMVFSKEYLTKEKYYDVLNSKGGTVQALIIKSTENHLMPFRNIQSLLVSLFLMLGITLIILGLDFENFNISKSKIMAISLPLLIAFILYNRLPENKGLSIKSKNLVDIENSLKTTNKKTNDIEGRVNDLEYRISDIEE